VELTFACDTSSEGHEEALYGCTSAQGIFSVPVQCDIQPPLPLEAPVTISPPPAMTAVQGQVPVAAIGNVLANCDLTGIICGFVEKDTFELITPPRITLGPLGMPASLASGNSVDLIFTCNNTSAGSEDILYRCLSDQGAFGLPVSCAVAADSDLDGVPDSQDDFPNDPTETTDTDGDGFSDKEEVDEGTDPLSKDSQSELQNNSNIILLIAALNAQKAAGPVVYSLDSGVGDKSVGCTPDPYHIEWANQFSVVSGGGTISEILVAFGDDVADAGATVDLSGASVQVRIYNDVDNNGEPNDLVELASLAGTIANYRTDTFNVYDIADTAVSGSCPLR